MDNVAKYIGLDLSSQLVESPGSPSRNRSLEKDQVVRKFKTRFGAVESLIPAFGSAIDGYPNHYLNGFSYNRTGEGDLTDVTLAYETNEIGSVLIADAPLPPSEIEWIGGTQDRHLGSHPLYEANKGWLGFPQTNGNPDPYGQPTQKPSKNFTTYLIPAVTYRLMTYSHVKQTLAFYQLGTLNKPTGEAGNVNQWLKISATLRIVKGVYQISQEWMFLPIGTFDEDVYTQST